jgi:hypothetical protein
VPAADILAASSGNGKKSAAQEAAVAALQGAASKHALPDGNTDLPQLFSYFKFNIYQVDKLPS